MSSTRAWKIRRRSLSGKLDTGKIFVREGPDALVILLCDSVSAGDSEREYVSYLRLRDGY
jgi:hypothetical protein